MHCILGANIRQPRTPSITDKSSRSILLDLNLSFQPHTLNLFNTPQALHWAYAFLYWTNAKAETPLGCIPEGDAAAPRGTKLPRKYACNKAIGQLSAKDIRGARKALAGLAHNVYRRAIINLDLAMTMLHEIAHALNVCYMGSRPESFFEGSFVAEHG
ncbi:hypothetical protein MBLNU13_g04093t2 [Cladosporium sp. NU13]